MSIPERNLQIVKSGPPPNVSTEGSSVHTAAVRLRSKHWEAGLTLRFCGRRRRTATVMMRRKMSMGTAWQ